VLSQKIQEVQDALHVKPHMVSELMDWLCVELQSLTPMFKMFTDESRKKSQLFPFWDDYITIGLISCAVHEG
jgi:hypothetical protein